VELLKIRLNGLLQNIIQINKSINQYLYQALPINNTFISYTSIETEKEKKEKQDYTRTAI